ncbi:MipA/OmpV family protein [Gallaecimonas sp. GXIMD4217]|uniref:MipA/OmpV family protein n=1 Tax=Gallaecimonas sp. GXIMD4217 TaxID=3131927 RepID=UPI00311B23B1
MLSKSSAALLLALGWCLMVPAGARADESLEPSPWRFSLALGFGQYGTVLHDSKAQDLHVLPHWSYYGERFYLEDLDLGFNLVESKRWSLDLTTRQSFDALLLRKDLDDAFLAGIADSPLPIPRRFDLGPLVRPGHRSLSYLGGLTLFWRHENWQLSSAWHTDISNVHHGSEWETKARYLFRAGPVDLAVTGQVRRLDGDYSNYYFGVHEDDINRLFTFKPGSQWLPSFKLEASYPLNDSDRLFFSWKREFLADDYEKSLFFKKLHHDVWFMGVSRTW